MLIIYSQTEEKIEDLILKPQKVKMLSCICKSGLSATHLQQDNLKKSAGATI